MKERIISAFVALLITLPLLFLGGTYFDILVLVVGLLGLKELLDLNKDIPILVKYISYLLFGLLLIFGYTYTGRVILLNYSLVVISLLVLLTSMLVYNDSKRYSIEDVFYSLGSIILLSTAFSLFSIIRRSGLNYMIYLLLITIMTDTFAYFIGRAFGKKKLMPLVSPNKTVEGFIGGLIFGTAIASMFYIFVIDSSRILPIILLTFILSIMGQVGDLVFSSIKRHYKIKDFSNIMPGHGGILDRLDSIIFVLFTYIILTIVL